MPYHNLHYRDYVKYIYRQMPIIKTRSLLIKALVTFPRIFLESLIDALGGILFLLMRNPPPK